MSYLLGYIARGFQDSIGGPFMFLLMLITLLSLGVMLCQVIFAKKINLTPLVLAGIAITLLFGIATTIFSIAVSFDAIANAPAAKRATELAHGISVGIMGILFSTFLAMLQVGVAGITTTIANKIREGK